MCVYIYIYISLSLYIYIYIYTTQQLALRGVLQRLGTIVTMVSSYKGNICIRVLYVQ